MNSFDSRIFFLNSKTNISLLFLAFFLSFSTLSQAQFIDGKIVDLGVQPELNLIFNKYEVFELNNASLKDYVTSPTFDNNLTLRLSEEHTWDLYLYPKDIRSDDYVANTSSGQILPKGPNITYSGHEKSSSGLVRMTITDGYVSGMIQKDGKIYMIESLNKFLPSQQNVNPNFFVVADMDEMKPHGKSCAFDKALHRVNAIDEIDTEDIGQEKMDCLIIELAIATDIALYNTYNGNLTNLNNEIIAVTNLVDGLYNLTYFSDDIGFSIVHTLNIDPSTNNPTSWATNNDSNDILGTFSTWCYGNGFGIGVNSYDIAQLWTSRPMNGGGVLGIAWLDGVCFRGISSPQTQNGVTFDIGAGGKYNVIYRFSGNDNRLAVVSAHEIGHNLDADHDVASSPHIMAPNEQSTTSWSTNSQTVINATMSSNNCFTTCTSGPTCFSNLTNGSGLPNNENGVADYESSSWIRSTANINNGARVDYDAASYIQLDGGFTVNSGATFNAFIDGCNGGNGGVNLDSDTPDALIDNESDDDAKLQDENTLGKEYIKIIKDATIKEIKGMR